MFLLHSGMKGILEEREGTKEFLWRERVDTHHWLFEAHSKLHMELCSRQEAVVEGAKPKDISVRCIKNTET